MSSPAGGIQHWRRCPAVSHSKDMNATPGSYPSPQMKASDADRDAVLSDLSEHFQAGRLDAEEFQDRSGRALAARTWGELRDLLQDLPVGPRVPATASPSVPPQRALGRTALVPVAVLAVIGIAVAMSVGHAHVLWLLFPILLIARRMTCSTGPARRSGLRA